MLRRSLGRPWYRRQQQVVRPQSCRSNHTFVPNDNVLLRPAAENDQKSIFVSQLTPGKHVNTPNGVIAHDDIIGKPVRSITDRAGSKQHLRYRLHQASLEEYVRLTKRLVTPIYPGDASLIVSLFDFHPNPIDDARGETQGPSISVLEAGTGHGSLTLYLSRAIHAANAPPPAREHFDDSHDYERAIETWKSTRAAVIHSMDISKAYSERASNVVKAFRHGMYHGNIDFIVSDVSSWLREALAARGKQPFLTHAFLDLPDAETHLDKVSAALYPDSTLIVFAPSITQITELLRKIKTASIPLVRDKVLELGVNGGSAGRDWDVRFVRPRATSKAAASEQIMSTNSNGDLEDSVKSSHGDLESRLRSDELEIGCEAGPSTNESSWSMVCRPKVGERIIGGGFLAVFKKARQ